MNNLQEKSSVEIAFTEIMNTIRNQDELIHSWTRSYITIQSGLFIAVGFLFKLESSSSSMLRNIGPILMAVLGIAFAVLLTDVIVREHKWQGHFIRALRRLPEIPQIYEKDPIPDLPGYIAKRFLALRWVIIAIWLCIAFLQISLIFGFLQQTTEAKASKKIKRPVVTEASMSRRSTISTEPKSTSLTVPKESSESYGIGQRVAAANPVAGVEKKRSELVQELKSVNRTIKESSKPLLLRDILFVIIGALASSLAGVGIPAAKHYRVRPILTLSEDKVVLEGKHLSLRIHNSGKSPAIKVAGYLSIDATKSDVLEDDPRGKNTKKPYVTANEFRQIEQEGLCWALIGNPHQRDIYPETFAILDVFAFEPNTEGGLDNILIPTENGWDKLRAALKPRKYTGKLVLASENSQPFVQAFQLEIVQNQPQLTLL